MAGFVGPKDIFTNAEAVFRRAEPQEKNQSPFDLHLTMSGDDFAIMGMHFKLGIYENQTAGAIQGVIDLLVDKANEILKDGNPDSITNISVRSYEPAFSIIGDPAKRDPQCRQTADHSMVYILGTLLRKAFEKH